MDHYAIYVVNRTTSGRTFFCFLAPPPMQGYAGTVYTHSSVCLRVAPHAPHRNVFRIPLRYVLLAGAGRQAPGLGAALAAATTRDVDLGDQWRVTFADPARREAAILTQFGSAAPAPGVVYQAGRFEPAEPAGEAANAWFASQGFGIRTGDGLMGVAWAALPGTTVTIIPQPRFQVVAGPYAAGRLADVAMVAASGQQVARPDFDEAFCCTVTLKAMGGWSIARGEPQA